MTLTIRYWLCIALVAIVVGCAQQEDIPSLKLALGYHYTTEGSYLDVRLEGSEIAFVHLDYDKVKEKCAQWIRQEPCWTEDDLVREEAELTRTEIDELHALVEETGVMRLDDYYGPGEGERCYAQTLTAGYREIVYCSAPNGPAAPEAFTRVSEKLGEMAVLKFPR